MWQQPDTDEAVPRNEFDFADLGRGEDQVLPIPSLNAVDVGSESLSATLCPTKAFNEYLVETISAFVEALGHNVVMPHSEQEPVLVKLLKAVQSRRVQRTLVRHGPRASHQSQGKIDNANRVINGVCRAMWLSLEDLLREKLPSDRHAPWCLTRFHVKNNGRTAFVRVFGKAYTSQVLPFGERVMYKYTSVPTSNLDQRWGHGIWVGKAPMTDEKIILTENGVQKSRSLHRVPPEERFVICELKKVRGLPWNGRPEILKATIVTQQDQDPSGHRHVYLTTRVQRLAAVAVSVWDHTQKHRACHRVPRISTGSTARASVFIIRSCCADANTKLSERADGFTDGIGGTTRTQRTQRSAAKRDANK